MTGVNFRFEGGKEIAAAMRELGAQAANRIARSALNRAATPVVRRAKELAPKPGDADDPYSTGALRSQISKRLRRQRRGSDRQQVVIGVEKPRSRIAHLVEFGAAHMPAEPFLRPALDEKAGEILQVMQQAMRVGIEREVAKLAQKHRTRKR